MSELSFKKIVHQQAREICVDIDLEPPAMALLEQQSSMSPQDFLMSLVAQNFFIDAIKFLSRALPKREATWWACLCARVTVCDDTPEQALKALELAEQWVYQPTEDHRRRAFEAAESAGFNHPASWSAMAAFWSGGSMGPPNAPPVPPADNLTGKATAGAIQLAGVFDKPELASQKYQHFLQCGIDIACGGNGRIETGGL